MRRAQSANTQVPALLAAVLQPMRFLPTAATLDGMLVLAADVERTTVVLSASKRTTTKAAAAAADGDAEKSEPR